MSDFFLDWIGVSADPYISFVRILCHFESATGSGVSRTYVNETSVVASVTTVGSALQYPDLSASPSAFGAYNLLYPGASNNGGVRSTEVPSVHDYDPGTGDFTEEFSVILPSTSNMYMLLDARAGGATAAYCIYCYATGVLEFTGNGSALITSASGVLSAGVRHHIAASRSSGVTRLFVDGIQVGSSADTNNYSAATNRTLGNYYNASQAAYGCAFDEWRLTVGVGRYTSNFTPPSAPFPNF